MSNRCWVLFSLLLMQTLLINEMLICNAFKLSNL
jgi:hypothetical protein